jgi:phosphatidate cytidylyltransferase
LQQRITTALVLVPVAVSAVLALPTFYFAIGLGLVLLAGASEWSVLAGFPSPLGRSAYALLVAVCLALLWPLVPAWGGAVLAMVALCWIGITARLLRVDRIDPAPGADPWLVPLGLLVLLGPWVALVRLHAMLPHGRLLVLFLLVLIWAADSLAYLAGRRWGRRRLAPAVSPGKTWLGVYAGLAGAAALGFVLAWQLGLARGHVALAVALCTATAAVSVVGDLFESLLKRRRGLKDSGRLLPGHGGILDRIDSLTAAAPLFVLGILWMEALL